MRKKILAFVFAAGLLVALAVPLFNGGASAYAGCKAFGQGTAYSARGQNPALPNPGDLGAVISADAQSAPGARADSVAAAKVSLCP